ncbi:3-methyladenine DNA glycosylase AlkD [Nocardioides daedukensis]|uniref:3-methyladenine DNA glycosylase AlkD n=1 Tax=Nocardioides daedukensis TaxID=634462 RepID=A0A7Y9RZB1_9ACTN|nr:DNA alkylation repair protein [Nocardioides daedukensis]NYG59005.1 3-methyladenine DNA glycosylase AlkD [Nocardioides daedukensis]
MTAPAELAALVRRRIAAVADPAKAPGMQAYMKSAMPYRGVTSVPLRRVLRETFDEHRLDDEGSWHDTVRLLWDGAAFREERYAATTLAGHRLYREHQQPHTLDLHRDLIVDGAWWDHVDDIATHLVRGILLGHREAVTPVLAAWACEDDMWLRRASIICQVSLRGDLDRRLLVHAIDANLDGSTRSAPAESTYGREFFIRKAIGWALRDHFRTDPDWVREFVAERGPRLSGLSRREALKHDR